MTYEGARRAGGQAPPPFIFSSKAAHRKEREKESEKREGKCAEECNRNLRNGVGLQCSLIFHVFDRQVREILKRTDQRDIREGQANNDIVSETQEFFSFWDIDIFHHLSVLVLSMPFLCLAQ